MRHINRNTRAALLCAPLSLLTGVASAQSGKLLHVDDAVAGERCLSAATASAAPIGTTRLIRLLLAIKRAGTLERHEEIIRAVKENFLADAQTSPYLIPELRGSVTFYPAPVDGPPISGGYNMRRVGGSRQPSVYQMFLVFGVYDPPRNEILLSPILSCLSWIGRPAEKSLEVWPDGPGPENWAFDLTEAHGARRMKVFILSWNNKTVGEIVVDDPAGES